MSKRAHLGSLLEQIAHNGHGSAPFHYGKKRIQVNESKEPEVKQKGSNSLENGLEAEQMGTNQKVLSFISEGNPNIQGK